MTFIARALGKINGRTLNAFGTLFWREKNLPRSIGMVGGILDVTGYLVPLDEYRYSLFIMNEAQSRKPT